MIKTVTIEIHKSCSLDQLIKKINIILVILNEETSINKQFVVELKNGQSLRMEVNKISDVEVNNIQKITITQSINDSQYNLNYN